MHYNLHKKDRLKYQHRDFDLYLYGSVFNYTPTFQVKGGNAPSSGTFDTYDYLDTVGEVTVQLTMDYWFMIFVSKDQSKYQYISIHKDLQVVDHLNFCQLEVYGS